MSKRSPNKHKTIRARRLPDGSVVQVLPSGKTQPLADNTDWARLATLSDAEVEAAAQADPDNPPLSDDELARMRRVPNPKEIRKRLRMTQAQFAAAFALPLGTLRDWEQGVRRPDSAAISYLRVIAKNPHAVRAALEEE